MIRNFQEPDMDQVLKIWFEASIMAHDFIEKEFWEAKVTDMREVYLPSAETYVYDEEGMIKGFISLYEDTIAAIFVSPTAQGKGIGKQLMEKAKGVRQSLNLTVYKKNSKSIDFYKKCAFKTQREQIDEHTGHPELLMTFTPQQGRST
ncbi:MAG: N-acetyltransferase [Desulfobacteraceae bacterium]|nr:N-acetyltransferase [Desulfobacteraceae bacterium]